MAQLVKGEWLSKDQLVKKEAKGETIPKATLINNWVTADGTAGATGVAGFKAEKNRYKLIVANYCAMSHRARIFRVIKGLEDVIEVAMVKFVPLPDGGGYVNGAEAGSGHEFLYQLYASAAPDYTGKPTLPVLWDKKQKCIVSTESGDIIRMFNSAFDGITGNKHDFYPAAKRADIDKMNELITPSVNFGVFMCAFAPIQAAYDKSVGNLFDALDKCEDLLGKNRYLTGACLTEADWRLFVTLVRFDSVFFSLFKCNKRMIEDYPNLSNFVRELYQHGKVADTVDLVELKHCFFTSFPMLNPSGIVPLGPQIDFKRSHDRARLPAIC